MSRLTDYAEDWLGPYVKDANYEEVFEKFCDFLRSFGQDVIYNPELQKEIN